MMLGVVSPDGSPRSESDHLTRKIPETILEEMDVVSRKRSGDLFRTISHKTSLETIGQRIEAPENIKPPTCSQEKMIEDNKTIKNDNDPNPIKSPLSERSEILTPIEYFDVNNGEQQINIDNNDDDCSREGPSALNPKEVPVAASDQNTRLDPTCLAENTSNISETARVQCPDDKTTVKFDTTGENRPGSVSPSSSPITPRSPLESLSRLPSINRTTTIPLEDEIQPIKVNASLNGRNHPNMNV